MPLLKHGDKNIPSWADYSEWGVSRMKTGDYVEDHFHDHHEWVIVVSGRLSTRTEGTTLFLGPGDVLLTPMGESHDWTALEDTVSVWAAARLQGKMRPGHLHHEKA
jgi:ethanolamine utilization protein EutQ (cupin superfamily)